MVKTLVVIPAYNEQETIGRLLDAVQDQGYESLVVTDGTDNTALVAGASGARVLEFRNKLGYGRAIVLGLRWAYENGYIHAVVMDVGTCDPACLEAIVGLGMVNDIGAGARRLKGLHWRTILSRLGALCASIAARRLVPEATTGYRCYNLKRIIPVLAELRTNGHATNFEILVRGLKRGLAVAFTPIEYQRDSNSQLRGKDLWEAIRCFLQLSVSR